MTEREPISGSGRDYGATAAPPPVAFADFSPTELYNLTEGIADNINSINSGLLSLEKTMKQIGGPNDNLQFREKVHGCQQAVNARVAATTRSLARLSAGARRGHKPHRLQVERLAQALADALDKYAAVQKQVSAKMAAHMPRAPRPCPSPPSPSASPPAQRQALADEEEAALLHNQQAQARLVQFETSMMLEREAYMSKIEADVLDVGQVMGELARLLQAQGQHVDSVAEHVEAAGARVEAGAEELAAAAAHQRRYRRKVLILTIVGLVLAVVFVVWVVRAFR
ncbi:unnamed protein product [Diatraea saccharalis]|uniref:t-SNARE coiled-coil homology domain-containing protein n=1 Tax=Diatraea saccharalis TaxID=40085 RepID=A0A9N9WG47_9NEOP|nr:unnamed protein product [Diatraea saccharalis]